MIITVEEYKKYLPNTDDFFQTEKMEVFELRALYKHFPKYIGTDLVNNLAGTTPTAGLLAAAKPALACLAVLESVPFMDLVATNNGFAIVSNPNLAPASRERVQALRDGCLVAANTHLDALLSYLEANKATYTTWNKSCINTDSLLPGVTEFMAATKLYVTRYEFVDMIPVISAIENTWLKKELSAQFLTEIVASTTDTVVKPLLRQALAFASLAKIEMATDKPDTLKVSRYSRFTSDYLGRAIAHMVTNLGTYPTYATYGYEAPFDNATDGTDYGLFIMGTP